MEQVFNGSVFLFDILGFFLKAGILVVAIGGLLLFIAYLSQMKQHQSHLKIEDWSEKWDHAEDVLKHELLSKEEFKKRQKEKEKQTKSEQKSETTKPRVFLLQFNGDIHASEVSHLKKEVNSLLSVAQKGDEVVLQLESPGGVVHGYGLAAAELQRLRDADLELTVCVDQVGASGGYMMACVGNRILAAPFAIIGSIGVLSQVPNFHRLLKKYDVDYREYTAGEYKRTVSVLGEITPEKEKKFLEMMQGTHDLFKSHVARYRPNLDLSQVATGEYWYGTQALHLGLIDEVRTSDDYLFSKRKTHKIVSVKYEKKKSLSERFNMSASKTAAFLGSWLRFFQSEKSLAEGLDQASKPWNQIQ